MARGKNPCKLGCERPANVKGGICHVCAETEEGKAFLAGLKPPELQDLPGETDLQAMETLWDQKGRPKSRKQDSFVVIYRQNAQQFYQMILKLRAGRTSEPGTDSTDSLATGLGPTWDGTGPCPLCKHEPEKRLEDPQTDMILGQIDRLLKRVVPAGGGS